MCGRHRGEPPADAEYLSTAEARVLNIEEQAGLRRVDESHRQPLEKEFYHIGTLCLLKSKSRVSDGALLALSGQEPTEGQSYSTAPSEPAESSD